MQKRLTLRPVDGLIVRDPLTTAPLPEVGLNVPVSSYWARRLQEGAVEEVPTAEEQVDHGSSL